MYSFPISSKPSSKSAVFNFDTPSAAFVSPPTRITVDISNDDLLKVSVKTFFVPRDIISAEPWATIVIGNTFASNMDSFICSRFPSAYIHFNDLESKQCGFFTSFRSVVYWNPEESMPKTQVSSNSFLRHALLALSSDGTTLKYIPFMSPASGGEVPKAESFNLPSKVSEIWSPSTGSCRRVLFSLSAGPDTDLAQQLVISDANQIVFTSNKVGFQLLPKEKVLQVVWKSDGLIQGNSCSFLHLCYNFILSRVRL